MNNDMQMQRSELSLLEVSRCCAAQTDFIIELVAEGVIAPQAGHNPESWRFTQMQVRHAAVAWRLQRDLGVNLAGAALALQLLDEVETLRSQITLQTQTDDAST